MTYVNKIGDKYEVKIYDGNTVITHICGLDEVLYILSTKENE